MYNISELARLAQKALDEETNGKEYMLADVYNQTIEAYNTFPEDVVIRQVAFVIEKKLNKAAPGALISQAEMSKIHNEFVRLSGESKFRDVLGHLLLAPKQTFSSQNPDYAKLNRVDAETSSLDTNDFVDQSLMGALNSVFGQSSQTKAFNSTLAAKGKTYVEAELKAIGFNKSRVEVMGGDQNALVYAAHLDSDKGLVTVAIPIELSSGKLLMPSVFVADDRLEELTGSNLSSFVQKKADASDFSTPTAKDVLKAVGILTGQENKVTTEEFDKVSASFKDSDSMAMNVPNLYLDRQYEAPRADIDTTEKVAMPKELAHLSQDFENDLLEVNSKFGRAAVAASKALVASELYAAGFKSAQVRFGSEDESTITCAATINTRFGPVQIHVPVEMRAVVGGVKPLIPTSFSHNGVEEEFTGPALQRFAASAKVSVAQDSSKYTYMVLPELKSEIIKAASVNDYTTCETVLSVIGDNFGEEDYKNAVSDYQYALSLKSKIASQEQHKCSRMIAAGKGSIYARCGHFGVPLQMVIAGANGECLLKSSVERQKLNPVEESSALISTSKINLT